MKKILLSFAFLLTTGFAMYAQNVTYHLPKTAIKISMLAEKTSYTPGDLAPYAQRFLKKDNVSLEKSETHRIIDVKMSAVALPDSQRVYSVVVDSKHNIQKVRVSEDNILLAINADAKPLVKEVGFVASKKPVQLDPTNYLNQDILAAGSRMKMAELCAQEIGDIRESRNELNRGQSEFMPKDGEQLRLMLENLDIQESALRQLFEGVTVKDTIQLDYLFVPTKDVTDEVLLRFSKYYGAVGKDDLSGSPYFITVEDLHSRPEHIMEQGKKAPKDETGVWIVLPGKIRVSLRDMDKQLASMEVSAAQFGDVENLNSPLFSKKVMTSIVLNQVNGGIDKIESVPVK